MSRILQLFKTLYSSTSQRYYGQSLTRTLSTTQNSSMSTSPVTNGTNIELLDTLSKLRAWREQARKDGKSVGFVPTMGALHAGHLSLVKHSLEMNDLTVVSIFVNPAQFAPHEDLATYPRTLESDLKILSETSWTGPVNSENGISQDVLRTPSAVFIPSVKDIYPSGIVQNVADQRGTFIEVKGYDHQMEGRSRPTFFRGVATVVTKLFNAVSPTCAYFGQKDIQQALLIRRLTRDLLLSHPSADNVFFVPTYRSDVDGLALSSRNAYLSERERQVAGCLYAALRIAEKTWNSESSREVAVKAAVDSIEATQKSSGDVSIRLDYIEINDPDSFEVAQNREEGRDVIISGALWIGKTRLIDNIIVRGMGPKKEPLVSF